jgi:hypothetical protein
MPKTTPVTIAALPMPIIVQPRYSSEGVSRGAAVALVPIVGDIDPLT